MLDGWDGWVSAVDEFVEESNCNMQELGNRH